MQLGVLEIHPWGSTNDSIERPDRIIFDLDPDEAFPWATLASAALELRAHLRRLKPHLLFKKHRRKGSACCRAHSARIRLASHQTICPSVVLQMEKCKPALYITRMTKAARAKKIYLDYLRNDREATAIAAFSTRGRPGIPIALPLDWKELQASSAPRFYY